MLHLAPGGPLSQFALSPGMTPGRTGQDRRTDGAEPPPAGAVSRLGRPAASWATGAQSSATGARCSTSSCGHLFATLLLIVSSTVISVGAWHAGRRAGRHAALFGLRLPATVGAMIALSIPTFWFGLVAIYVFSLKLGWLPSGNMYTIGDESRAGLRCTTSSCPSRSGACAGRDLVALHALVDAGRDRPGFRPHGAGQGADAAARALCPHPAQRADSDDHAYRASNCRRCCRARW